MLQIANHHLSLQQVVIFDKSNITYHWSQVTITKTIIVKKLEILWELPKCAQRHKVSNGYWKDGAQRLVWWQGCWNLQFVKKKKKKERKKEKEKMQYLQSAIEQNPRKKVLGLPWWLSGKESTCQCRRHRFDPWFGKIPHAGKWLSPCATTIEPVLQRPRATLRSTCAAATETHASQSPCSTREATATRNLCTTTREQPQLATPREKPLQSKK